jgi:hypothetical protein
VLTFHFSASPALDAFKNGNHWCSTPDDLTDFEALIAGSDVYRAASVLRPSKVTFEHDEV